MAANPFFTIGHSTRSTEAFVALLQKAEVRLVVDVRTVPRSRTNPQFNRDVLPASLAEIPDRLRASGVARRLARHPARRFAQDQRLLGEREFSQFRRLRHGRGLPLGPRKPARGWAWGAVGRNVRRGGLVAMSSPHHCGLSHRGRGRGGLSHSRRRPHRAGAHDACRKTAAEWNADLSQGGLPVSARRHRPGGKQRIRDCILAVMPANAGIQSDGRPARSSGFPRSRE